MEIREITGDRKRFLPLLLLADEQESMVGRYLERGVMYVLDDNGVKAECVVTDEGDGVLEIKNIAVVPECHGLGYGRALLDFVARTYKGIPFYEKCGFVRSHRIEHFFTDHYDHPIIECGVRLVDMIVLRREL